MCLRQSVACCQEDAVACRSWNTKVMMMHFHTHFTTRENHLNILYSDSYRRIESWSHPSITAGAKCRRLQGARSWRHGIRVCNHPLLALLTPVLNMVPHPACKNETGRYRVAPISRPKLANAVTSLARQGLGKISRLCVCGNRARTDWSPAWDCPVRESAQVSGDRE